MKLHLIPLLTIAITAISCSHSSLEQAIKIAGSNRTEHKCKVMHRSNTINILGYNMNTPHSYQYSHKIGKPPIKEKTICKTADIVDCRLLPAFLQYITKYMKTNT